jgi:hypothetical protein
MLAFDASGNPIASSTVTLGVMASAFIQTLLDDADAPTARQTLLLDKKGADIASAATINLDTATGDLIDVTGTTTITAITLAEGLEKTVRFTGALTLTHGASLVLPGGANILTAAGDFAVFRGYAAGVVRCVVYTRSAIPPVVAAGTFEARLTLLAATPVTKDNQLARTLVYLTPYKSNRIALFDGANWKIFTLSEISIAVPATTDTNYDVFVFDSAGTPTLELTAWSGDTTRATALVLQDGIFVKTGALTRRYVGSFRTTGVSGQTEDSAAKRFLWNYYNRVRRTMRKNEGTSQWTYTLNTWRQANANAGNQLDFIIGVDEVAVEARVAIGYFNASLDVQVGVSIGLDSTTVPHASCISGHEVTQVANSPLTLHATLSLGDVALAPGRHRLVWLEVSEPTGTTNWLPATTDGGAGFVAMAGLQGMLEG